MVAERQFRSDLYYRLNAFPIRIPPLRKRSEDIPLLARQFVSKYAQEMNKQIESVPPEVMDLLRRHDWPGNVRELENFIRGQTASQVSGSGGVGDSRSIGPWEQLMAESSCAPTGRRGMKCVESGQRLVKIGATSSPSSRLC